MHFMLSPLIAWTALWIVETHSEFQENIFNNNNKDITNVKVSARRRRRPPQGYGTTSAFLRKKPSLKLGMNGMNVCFKGILLIKIYFYTCFGCFCNR